MHRPDTKAEAHDYANSDSKAFVGSAYGKLRNTNRGLACALDDKLGKRLINHLSSIYPEDGRQRLFCVRLEPNTSACCVARSEEPPLQQIMSSPYSSTINDLVAGSFGGAAQVLVGQPLDTVKTRAQIAPSALTSPSSPCYFT